jgi:hypothetical protein
MNVLSNPAASLVAPATTQQSIYPLQLLSSPKTPDESTLKHTFHYTHQHRHHAPHLLHAPVARPHRFADPEPTASLRHHQEWQVLWQGQHWYVELYALNTPYQHGLIGTSAGHNFRKSVHPGAFGPDLAKKLSQLVKMEKNVMRSMELVGRERMEVAVSFINIFCLLKQR